MSLETDLLIDRRRLKRRLFFWRIAAIAAALVAIGIAVNPERITDHIARLRVEGTISDTSRMIRALDEMVDDSTAKALVLAIDSPGGGVYASEALHSAITRVAAKKPVVVVMGATAASGGFMIAMPAKRIFAGPATITGSIGVILQTAEFSGLMDKVGVTSEALISGPLKDQPSPTHRLSSKGRSVLQALVTDMYEQFVTIVADGRHLDPAKVRDLADGRVFTGRQALDLGLVDAIGDEPAAIKWLETDAGVAAKLPVRDLRTRGAAAELIADSLAPVFGVALKTVLYQGLGIDGAQALWQPSVGE